MNGTNGNGHVLRWMLGIVTTIIAMIGATVLVGLCLSVMQNTSDLRLIKSQQYGVEQQMKETRGRVDALERSIRGMKGQHE